MTAKLREGVTFLPLKDLRYSNTALQGHTWFMSSTYDKQDDDGSVQYQHFPSKASNGRLLCLKGQDTHDGVWNSYALAWPDTLPHNATLLKGLTFVSYNHYNYENIWHGLSAVMPFVAWHVKGACRAVPARWVLYHWGEVRRGMGVWLGELMRATFGEGGVGIENFGGVEGDGGVCLEEAVVMRHNEGGMSRVRREEVYDVLRCRAREYCGVGVRGGDRGNGGVNIGMSLLMRNGARSFSNGTAVAGVFQRECLKVAGCRFRVAHSNNLSFCEQVRLMSETDILISPHGAQLTNMFFMDKNSSVMEFFPKGWLKLAGVGQYVFQWIASWSGMRHQGAWRDPNGDPCPYPEDDRRCFNIYKGGLIGHNETQFAEWAQRVLNEVKINKINLQKDMEKQQQPIETKGCTCKL
ncbi:hypothetical protein Scep_001428 [Stephania cephalantha]|uniref:Glycosyltransferase 61 catalytic domain-containing protein n=1 Tax=Stephania cephalantha TaxID=152367 RepID=A0AAP0Q3C3_9MAGN